jgi:Uncharacterised nucleotidyltransferase
MTAERRWAARRALAQDAVLGEVVRALAERDIRPLLIKGAATVHLLGVDPGTRPSVDVDLLVARPALPAAAEVLTALGFRDKRRDSRPSELAWHTHAQEWTRGDPLPMAVDLHYSVGRVRASETLFATLSRDAEPIMVGPTMVDIPGPAACALIVALHAAQHGLGSAKALDDLSRAVVSVPEETWRQAGSLAAELRVVSSFAFGLRLVEGGAGLADRLGVLGAGTAMDHLRAHDSNGGTEWIHRLRRARTFRAAATVLRDALVPSPGLVRANHPGLGPGRSHLAVFYLRRWLRIPRALVRYARVRVRNVDD